MTWTNLLVAIAIAATGHFAGTWLAGVARLHLTRTGMDPEIRRLVGSVIRPLVLIAALLMALPWIGVEPTSLVAVLGAATLAVGLALKSTLSNVASGAILLTIRPYREGDVVEVAGRTGTLEALEIYQTTVRTAEGTLVTLPNDLVLRSPIVNFTRIGRRRADVEWVIAPDGKLLSKAIEALQQAAVANEKVLSDPAPVVVVTAQRAGGIVLTARPWVEAPDFGAARAELLTAGLEALAKAKIPLATYSPVG